MKIRSLEADFFHANGLTDRHTDITQLSHHKHHKL